MNDEDEMREIPDPTGDEIDRILAMNPSERSAEA